MTVLLLEGLGISLQTGNPEVIYEQDCGLDRAQPQFTQEEPQMQPTSTAAAYDARLLKLRLPKQDALKKAAERCSADPVSLTNIGRAVGQQVRIKRRDDPRFVAVYTVNQPNPDDPSPADIVRAGRGGRERLGTSGELDAIVEATVLDARFFEVAHNAGDQFVVIAPHGGMIEQNTDEQATEVFSQLDRGFSDVAVDVQRIW
jgi:hypothetical protein